MKKINQFLFGMFLFFACLLSLDAISLKSVKVNAVLDYDGTMHVTEVWDMYTNKDTEIYKEESNLGNMVISNFKVSDEKREYELLPYWDINASFEAKKYKYGINNGTNGKELCWGISEYGDKTYTFSYDLSNAIFNTDDAQVLYMRMINDLDFPAEKFEVIISGPTEYSDSLDVWGYGYKGYAYVNSGKIYMSNEENTPLSNGDYGVLLVKFPQNTFSVYNRYDQYSTFNDVYEAAEEGTTEYDYGESFWDYLWEMIPVFVFYGGFIWAIVHFVKNNSEYKFGQAGKKINMKEINAFRDIPCDKDVFRAYFIAQAYKLNKKNTDFFGTLLLKWLDEDKISIVKEEKSGLLGTKETTSIDFKNYKNGLVEVENDMAEMMMTASEDNILEEKEFEKYSRKHYQKLFNWFKKAEKHGRQYYVDKLLVVKKGSKYHIDDKLMKEALELAGLKKYLKEFSRMETKAPIEVKLWKQYLMYAQIFGMADEVAKQFEKLYPEIVVEMNDQHFNTRDIILLNHFSNTAVVSASSARSAASSYSGGGGGFSSGGGGGGSFGGGGGGSR